MTYRERKDLTILELEENEENISFDKLEKVILNRPSNAIYCERDKQLHGIITMGDLLRASRDDRDFVSVNTRFTSIQEGEYMKARNIFLDRPNISSIPALDKDGKLTGAWSRWNDLLYIENMFGGGSITILPAMTRWH